MGFMNVEGLKSSAKHEPLEDKAIVVVSDVPFIPSNKNIFEQCLHIAGLTWSDIIFINIFEDQKSIQYLYNRKSHKFLKNIVTYQENLKKRLSRINCNVIVTLGDAALQIITDKIGSYTWRGSILSYDYTPGTSDKVIPTLHPSYAIKTYIDRYKIIADLRRAKDESAFKELHRLNRTLRLSPDKHEVLAYLDSLHELDRVSIDIECNGALETSCIAYARSPTDCMCIPFYKIYWSPEDEIAIWKAIARIHRNSKVSKIGQNFIFDMSFLFKKNWILTQGKIYDTMIAQALLYPGFPKGLDFLCSMYTDEPYYKDEGKIWKNPKIDLVTFWRYNAKDAATTYEIWDVLEKQLEKRGYKETYDRTSRLINPLLFIENYGIKANLDALADTKKDIEAQIAKHQETLDTLCGEPLNVNSPKACQQYFYIKKGIKPYYNKGRVTTDNKAMMRIARLGFPEATEIQEIRGLRKLKGTYLDINFDEDNRLRSSYNPVGTTTGRLSSSKTIFGTGTNFQNIPSQIRKFLEADDGKLLVEVDKVQAEWIAVAYISNDANMIEVVEKKLDAHTHTTCLMFDMAPEDVTPEWRKKGKVCNHSLNYDMGYKSFALQWGFKEREAKDLVNKYHRAYPGIRLWHEKVRNQLSNDRTLYNCFGRPRRFLDRWGDSLFKAAYAYNPQSTVVELVNTALCKTYENPLLNKLYLIGQVHDSILCQQDYNDMPAFIFMLKKLVQYLDVQIPCNGRNFIIPTEIKVGFNWKDLKTLSKGNYDWSDIQDRLMNIIETQKDNYVSKTQ